MPTLNIEKTFGIAIAFLFPGLIGLYALSLHIEILTKLLGTTSTSPTTGPGAAGFFLVLFLAAGFGAIVSGPRSELIDKRWRQRRQGERDEDWATPQNEAQEAATGVVVYGATDAGAGTDAGAASDSTELERLTARDDTVPDPPALRHRGR